MLARVITGVGMAKADKVFMTRILGSNGRPITRASLAGTVAYSVKDLYNDSTPTAATLAIADVVYNDLQQNDPRWDLDSEDRPGKLGYWGYNFLATLPASLFPGHADSADEDLEDIRYRVDFKFAETGGGIIQQPFEFVARRVYF